MKPKEHLDHAGLVSLRLLIALAICLGAPFLLRGASGPAWWYNGSLTTTGTPLVSGTANDFAAINQGQAKNVAVTAINELNTDLAQFGGAGDTLNQLALTLTATSAQTNDYAALSIGQLKFLAQPFYDRLISLSCTVPPIVSGTYPWVTSGLTANDFAIANIGQTKQLFSFDVTASSAGNGIPDWWVNEYFPGSTINGTVGIDPNGYVSWSGTTLTNLQAYQQGLNPLDFYNGQVPNLSIVSGNPQTGPPGGYLPLPLVVSVTGSNGAGIEGAPLTFQVTSGGGYIQPPGSATAGSSCTQFADSNGQAQVYFLLSGTPSTTSTSTITVTTGTGATAQQVQFSASSDDGTGTFASPFAPSNSIGTVNDDGSFTITWTNNTNGIESYIVIEQQQPDGTWLVISPQLPPGTTSYTIASPTGSGPYHVVSYTPSPSGTGNLSSTSNNTFPIIPTQSYAAIDISGTIGAPNVSQIALDDGGNAAFDLNDTEDYTYSSYILQNGTATLAQNITFVPDIYFPVGEYGNGEAFVEGSKIYIDVGVDFLTPTGAGISESCQEFTGDLGDLTQVGTWAVKFIGGQPTDLVAPNPPYGYSSLSDAHDFGYCGGVNGMIIDNQGNGVISGTTVWGSIIASPAGTVLFDPFVAENSIAVSGSAVVIDSAFSPLMMNANGWAVGRDAGIGGYDDLCDEIYDTTLKVWDGTETVSIDPMAVPCAINSVGQVLGSASSAAIGACLWTGTQTTSTWHSVTPGSVQSLYQLIPSPLQRLIANTGPIALSGTDQNGNVRILFSANYQTDSAGDWAPGKFLLTLVSGSNPILRRVSFPPNVSPQIFSMNSQGVIAGLGDTTGGNAGHALLLVPVQLTNKADPTKRNGANGNDRSIDLMTSNTGTDINAVAWIAASDTTQAQVVTGVYPPRMPELVASSGSIPGITYCWKLQVIFHDRHGNPHRDFDTGDPNDTNSSSSVAPQDTVTIPAANSADSGVVNGWKQITDGSPWNIYQSNDWINALLQNGFFGGDAELSLKILDSNGNSIMPEQDYYFRIEGENPDPGVCQTYINTLYNGPTPNWQNVTSTGTTTPPTVPGYWFAYAIAKEETVREGGRTWYNNFLDNGGQYQAVPGKEGKPDWNNDGSTKYPTKGTGGYGLFQLTFQPGESNYPVMPRDWIWNWESNVQQFQLIIQQKLSYTQAYLNYIYAHHSSYFDPSALTTTADMTTFNFWESSVITLNNAAPIVLGGQYLGAWTFTPSPAGWKYKKNGQNYLYKVAYHGVENHP